MLEEIYINNFVLIDKLRLEFQKGLNVLTGETGAGKSIIIDALGLVMGERVKNDFIKDSSKKAAAEAVFNVQDYGEARAFLLDKGLIEKEDSRIIISRQISTNGRSSVRINEHTVTLNTLKILAAYLLDMHLQHEHMSILRPDKYMDYVDSFIPDNKQLLTDTKDVFLKLKEMNQLLEKLTAEEQDKQQKIDFLKFQIQEIENARLMPNEEKDLEELQTRIVNSQNLLEGADKLLQLLYRGEQFASAYDLLSEARDTASGLAGDAYFSSLTKPLEGMCYSLQDITRELASYKDSLDFEPGLLEEVEERLYVIKKVKTKYGNNIDEIYEFLDNAKKELDILENSQAKKEELEAEIQVFTKEYFTLASDLTQSRKKAAEILQDKVNSELLQLTMPHIRFSIEVQDLKTPGPKGVDKIEFMFSPNPGEVMRPLSRIASGGEISRFVLALKKALAEAYKLPTLIFDEIDVGVGGTALNTMALKLSQLSNSHQVILVTHSPQIAIYAKTHYLIKKHFQDKKTCISVEKLNNNKRIMEIARMLDGEHYSDITVQHATEMVNSVKKDE